MTQKSYFLQDSNLSLWDQIGHKSELIQINNIDTVDFIIIPNSLKDPCQYLPTEIISP